MGGLWAGLAALMMSAQLPPSSIYGAQVQDATVQNGSDPTLAGDELFDASTDKIARMTVGVKINGKGPFPFVVDTAADRSVISSRLAREIGLPAGRALKVHGVSGSNIVPSVTIETLSVGSREIFDVRAPIFEEKALGAPGLLGIDALADQRVTMDFRTDKLTVHKPARREAAEDEDVIVVTARRRFGQLILADVAVRNDKVYAIVDSGAQVSIGNSKLRERLFRGKDAPPPMRVTLIGVDGKETPADFIVITEMRIGSMYVRNVPVAFADVPPFAMFKLDKAPAMLLGTDMLRGFERVSLDFEKKNVRFARKRVVGRGLALTP